MYIGVGLYPPKIALALLDIPSANTSFACSKKLILLVYFYLLYLLYLCLPENSEILVSQGFSIPLFYSSPPSLETLIG